MKTILLLNIIYYSLLINYYKCIRFLQLFFNVAKSIVIDNSTYS